MEDEKNYLTLRLKNVKLIVYRKKCPNCKKWVYPEQGLLKNARIGLSLVSFVISRRIRTGFPYEVIIDDYFGSNFSISVLAIIDWFKDFSDVIEGLYELLEELVKTSKLHHLLSDIIELIVKLEKENERIEKKLEKHQEVIQKEEKFEGTPKKLKIITANSNK